LGKLRCSSSGTKICPVKKFLFFAKNVLTFARGLDYKKAAQTGKTIAARGGNADIVTKQACKEEGYEKIFSPGPDGRVFLEHCGRSLCHRAQGQGLLAGANEPHQK
jgi:hypothetical protein